MISDARSMDRDKSLDLLRFYVEVQREITGLDDTFLNLLQTSEGDVLLKMRSRMERMESRDYVVLVAGKNICITALIKATESYKGTIPKKLLMCYSQF